MDTKNKAIAEKKLAKIGEILTGSADDNPVPSISQERACVETRRQVCIKCNKILTKSKRKFCSVRCRNNYISYNWRVKKGLITNPGVGSGGNQFDKNNHMYKNGIGSYSSKGFNLLPNICNNCGSTYNLLVHHIDENRSNNDILNLQINCKKCHQEKHCKRDRLGRYTKG